MSLDVVSDRLFEVGDAGENTAPNGSTFEGGEPGLDGVEPGSARRREMEVESGIRLQPCLHLFGRVSGTIVEDDVNNVTCL